MIKWIWTGDPNRLSKCEYIDDLKCVGCPGKIDERCYFAQAKNGLDFSTCCPPEIQERLKKVIDVNKALTINNVKEISFTINEEKITITLIKHKLLITTTNKNGLAVTPEAKDTISVFIKTEE